MANAIRAALSVVPFLSFTLATAEGSVPLIPPLPTVPSTGRAQIYYWPNSQYVVTASGIAYADTGSALGTLTGTVQVDNLVTGAVVLAPTAMTVVSSTSLSYTLLAANLPAGDPLLVTVLIKDGGVTRGLRDALLLSMPAQQLIYRYNGITTFNATSVVDNTGANRTSANTTLYFTATDKYTSASIQAQAAFAYLSAATWQYNLSAFSGEPVLAVTLDAYDQTGSGGVHYGRWSYMGYRG